MADKLIYETFTINDVQKVWNDALIKNADIIKDIAKVDSDYSYVWIKDLLQKKRPEWRKHLLHGIIF